MARGLKMQVSKMHSIHFGKFWRSFNIKTLLNL